MQRKNGSWIIKDSRNVFENEFFKVREDEVVRPDGKDSKYATIDFRPGVAILPVGDDGSVYLTRQFRYALGRESIECVAGNVADEDAMEAAKRELKEELGIEANRWARAGRIEALTSITKSRSDLFIVHGLKFGRPNTEGTEEIKLLTVSLDEAFEKVMSGEIMHSETCVLILKAYAER